MESKTVKVGAGLISSAGLITLILSLHGDVTSRLESQRAEAKEYVREHVRLSMKPLETEIKNLKNSTTETKRMVRDIHNYLLKKGKTNE